MSKACTAGWVLPATHNSPNGDQLKPPLLKPCIHEHRDAAKQLWKELYALAGSKQNLAGELLPSLRADTPTRMGGSSRLYTSLKGFRNFCRDTSFRLPSWTLDLLLS